MQLALQDFAVEVKAVHSGVDVLEVARTFKPEIVFADVLLQKKNGYEVTGELKSDAEMKSVPVVLMWSSFMELDQALYQKSKADGKLEKPFDVETLRRLVKDNVKRLRNDALSGYLKFPKNISSPLEDEESQKKTAATRAPQIPDAPPPLPEETDEFQVADLTATKPQAKASIELPPPQPIEDEPEEAWVKKDISKFTLDLQPIALEGEDAAISFDIHHGSLEGEKQLTNVTRSTFSNEPTSSRYDLRTPPAERTKAEELPFPDFDKYQADDAHLPVIPEIEFTPSQDEELTAPSLELKSKPQEQLSADQLEKIIRAQSKEVIEEVVRKVVPELANKIIREELNRLLAENSQ